MNHVLHRSLTAHLAVVLIASWTSIAWAQQDPNREYAVAHEAARVGDPYTLDVDPVTGDKLPDVKQQIIIDHEGRELRFGSTDSVEAFRKDPGRYLSTVDDQVVSQQSPYYPLDNCVVMGGLLLGEMGEPVDYVYKNRHFRFCCKMCRGFVNRRPADYFDKLDEAVKQQQLENYPLDTCPVSGNKLGGAMGDPIDVVIANRLVRVCCMGCVGKLRADPVKYLAVLDATRPDEDT